MMRGENYLFGRRVLFAWNMPGGVLLRGLFNPGSSVDENARRERITSED